MEVQTESGYTTPAPGSPNSDADIETPPTGSTRPNDTTSQTTLPKDEVTKKLNFDSNEAEMKNPFQNFIDQEKSYIDNLNNKIISRSFDLEYRYSFVQSHTQCLFLGYNEDQSNRRGIPYTGYALNCKKNIALNKSIKNSNGRAWTPSVKFFTNILNTYHKSEGNKYGANLHESILKGGCFSKLFKVSHLICPACYNKMMMEILGGVELQEFTAIDGDPLSNIVFTEQFCNLGKLRKVKTLYWEIFSKYKRDAARNIVLEWTKLNASIEDNEEQKRNKITIKNLIMTTVGSIRSSRDYLKNLKSLKESILLSLEYKKVGRSNLLLHSGGSVMLYNYNLFINGLPYSKTHIYSRLSTFYLEDYLNRCQDNASKKNYEKQKINFLRINNDEKQKLLQYYENYINTGMTEINYVSRYNEEYLSLKYLKFDLIDKQVIGHLQANTGIKDDIRTIENQYWNTFINANIEKMNPKPDDTLRIFNRDNFKSVINLLNGKTLTINLSMRTVSGKRSREEVSGTPRFQSEETKHDIPSFDQLPESPINSPRPKARRTTIRQENLSPDNQEITSLQASAAASAIFSTKSPHRSVTPASPSSAFNRTSLMSPPAAVSKRDTTMDID